MATILCKQEAALELRQADLIWRAYHPGQPRLLADEVNQAQDRLTTQPRIGPAYTGEGAIPGLRRVLLRGCQHHLYYVYDQDRDEVILTGIESIRRGRKRPRLGRG